MSDAQIPVLKMDVAVTEYAPGSTDENAPLKYVKLGKDGQFEWDKPLMDTKKGFKEKYRYADVAIAVFEKSRMRQVNKTGSAMPVKADPDPVIPMNQILNQPSQQIVNIKLSAGQLLKCS